MTMQRKIWLGCLTLVLTSAPGLAADAHLYHCMSESREWRVNVFAETAHRLHAGVRQQLGKVNVQRGHYRVAAGEHLLAGEVRFRGLGFDLVIQESEDGAPGQLRAILRDGTRLNVPVSCTMPREDE